MAAPLRIVAVNAGLSEPSSTRLLVDRLVAATEVALADNGRDTAVEVIDLRELAADIGQSLAAGFPTGATAEAIALVENADAVIAATPVFNASYAGLFKSFFDLVTLDEVTGIPTVIAATGGSPRHSMVLDHALRPLFSYLRMPVAPTGVYASGDDWAGSADGVSPLAERISRSARELVGLIPDFTVASPPQASVDESSTDRTSAAEAAGIANFARLMGD